MQLTHVSCAAAADRLAPSSRFPTLFQRKNNKDQELSFDTPYQYQRPAHPLTTACSACCCSGELSSSVAVPTRRSRRLLLPNASRASLDSGSSAFLASQRAAVAFKEVRAEALREGCCCCCCFGSEGPQRDAASCCLRRPKVPCGACVCFSGQKDSFVVRQEEEGEGCNEGQESSQCIRVVRQLPAVSCSRMMMLRL